LAEQYNHNVIFSAETGTPLTIRRGVEKRFKGVSRDLADYPGGDWRLPGNVGAV
jgi:hypothetical protein